MNKILFILLIIIPLIGFGQKKIEYFLSEEDHNRETSLKVVVNDEVLTLISGCIRIERIEDFNKDGYEDVLIQNVIGCGGNCCGDSYQIFCFDGNIFKKTKEIGYDWDGIEISESSNGFNFIVENVYEGFGNPNMCNNTVETYKLSNYEFEIVSTIKDHKLTSITELTSEDFNGKEDGSLFLKFDLDNDGLIDIIKCSYWMRWGRIGLWSIKFGNGKVIEGKGSPKRIGVLETKTNNVNDLVLECDEVLKWNGSKYQFPSDSKF